MRGGAMNPSRRQVLRWITVTAAGGAVLSANNRLVQALVQRTPSAPLVWINGGDHLNALTLLGQRTPDFLELVAVEWNVREFHGLQAIGSKPPGKPLDIAPVVIVEMLPPADAMEQESRLAEIVSTAKTAILLGTDACFGIHTAPDRIAAFEQLCKRHKTPLIKIPGIPVPPHHLIGVLGHLEFFGFPRLDANRRPLLYYGETVCRHCEFRSDLALGRFAQSFGEAGCLLHLGCKGPITHNSCSRVLWNERENWCVGAGGPCTGCSEPGFPHHDGLGLVGTINGSRLGDNAGLARHLEGIGLGLAALAAVAVGIKGLRRLFARPDTSRGV